MRRDLDFAERLREVLSANNVPYWIDQEELTLGTRYASKPLRNIRDTSTTGGIIAATNLGCPHADTTARGTCASKPRRNIHNATTTSGTTTATDSGCNNTATCCTLTATATNAGFVYSATNV